jgi:hypothetical protein
MKRQLGKSSPLDLGGRNCYFSSMSDAGGGVPNDSGGGGWWCSPNPKIIGQQERQH